MTVLNKTRAGVFVSMSAWLSAVAMLLAFAAGAAAADTVSQNRKLLNGRLMEYDDAEGYFEFKAKGDHGSTLCVRMNFTGFYVFPQLMLSQMIQQQGMEFAKRAGKGLVDSYIIIPKDIKVTVTVNAKYKYEFNFKGYVNSTTNLHKLNEVFTHATVPPEKELKYTPEIFNWIGQCKTNQFKNNPFFNFSLSIIDRSPIGGDTLADIDAGVTIKGGYTEIQETTLPNNPSPVTRNRKGDYRFEFSAIGERPRAMRSVSTRSWPMVRCNSGAVKIETPISWQDLILDVGDEYNVPHSGHPGGGTLLSDRNYKVSFGLHLRPMKELKVYLDPVSTTEEFWAPTPGETRSYRLTLEDPGPEDVEAIRFTLTETSKHLGIAINAGNHVRGEKCEDCKKPKKPLPWKWSVLFPVRGGEREITRYNEYYNECVLDSQPDIFFIDKDNPDYTMGEHPFSEKLNYTISQTIERDEIKDNKYEVNVRVMDGAASSKLGAEVKVAGIWYPAQARGKTATTDGTKLMLPRDSDHNGLQDEWQDIWGVSKPDADEDCNPKGKYIGDGLTNFEEYRGVYAKGKYHRLSPIDKTLFVHDYSGYFGGVLDDVAGAYLKQKLKLVPLDGDEFYQDTINFNSGEHKKGYQYILNVMWINQTPGLDIYGFTGMASHLGPPTREYNTIIVDISPIKMHYLNMLDDNDASTAMNLTGFLGHEIGHNINLPHHGDSEGYRNVNGKRAWVACLAGQHSGNEDCFMRYYNTAYFFNATAVPQVFSEKMLDQMIKFSPKGKQDHFCDSPSGSSICGDAAEGRGNCLDNIKIKSY